jgi:hypothetical protein
MVLPCSSVQVSSANLVSRVDQAPSAALFWSDSGGRYDRWTGINIVRPDADAHMRHAGDTSLILPGPRFGCAVCGNQ